MSLNNFLKESQISNITPSQKKGLSKVLEVLSVKINKLIDAILLPDLVLDNGINTFNNKFSQAVIPGGFSEMYSLDFLLYLQQVEMDTKNQYLSICGIPEKIAEVGDSYQSDFIINDLSGEEPVISYENLPKWIETSLDKVSPTRWILKLSCNSVPDIGVGNYDGITINVNSGLSQEQSISYDLIISNLPVLKKIDIVKNSPKFKNTQYEGIELELDVNISGTIGIIPSSGNVKNISFDGKNKITYDWTGCDDNNIFFDVIVVTGQGDTKTITIKNVLR